MTWSDKQLRAHKKASAGLSVATSTLGIGALGIAGARAGAGKGLKLAQKAGRLKNVTPAHVKHFKAKSTGVQTGLLTASAGLGGVGGFNYAGIQSAEAKRSKVAKRERFRPTAAQNRQIQHHANKGEAIGTAAGLAATAAFPGVRRAAVGSAKLSRALYQGGKVASGGRKAIGGAPSVGGHLRKVQSNVKGATKAGLKGASVGPLYLLEKHPKQFLGAAGTAMVGSQTGAQVGHSRKRGQLKRQQGFKTTFIKSDSADLDMGLAWVRPGEISKAYDPERKRKRRLDVYTGAAGVGSAGLAGASAVHGRRTLKQARTVHSAWKPKGNQNRTNVGDLIRRGDVPAYPGLKPAAKKAALGHLGKKGAVTAALGLGAVGAAVGADRIQRYKHGNGRTYRPLHAQI